MGLSEFVVPVLTTAGSVGLVYVILHNLPPVAKALLTMLVASVFMFSGDENRRQRGSDVLDKLTVPTMTAARLRLHWRSPSVSAAASCSRMASLKCSGLSALMVATGAPAGFAHHVTPPAYSGTYQISQRPAYC
jgi:hypothetical protein